MAKTESQAILLFLLIPPCKHAAGVAAEPALSLLASQPPAARHDRSKTLSVSLAPSLYPPLFLSSTLCFFLFHLFRFCLLIFLFILSLSVNPLLFWSSAFMLQFERLKSLTGLCGGRDGGRCK